MNKMQNLMLTYEDFKCLVRGGIIECSNGQNIALQDIGFEQMNECIGSAISGIDIYKNHVKEI